MITRWHRAAVAEFEATIGYLIVEASTDIAASFSSEVAATVERLKRFPLIGKRVAEQARRCPVARFPFDVIYAVRHEELLILAVAHQRRRPGYWKVRATATP